MKPTDEQIRVFWKWCGLHCNDPNGGYFWDNEDNLIIDMHKGENGLDLNNLFRWASPKLDGFYVDMLRKRSCPKSKRHSATAWLKDGHRGNGYDEDPTNALFWAIWQIIPEALEKEVE